MKRTVIGFFLLFVGLNCVFSLGTTEAEKVNLGVMQGPTGFSAVFLDDFINVSVYPSPAEVISKIASGELDMAVVPANYAAVLYNKGYKIKALAIVGEGMLSVLGTDENARILSVPGISGTPAYMATLLYSGYVPDYSVTAPAQLAQMLIAGKRSLAILPQPFVNMVIARNPDVKIFSDVQEEWKNKTGFLQYPMSILIVRSSFNENNRKSVENIEKSFRQSIEKVLSNPLLAGTEIEKKGIMKAEIASSAIPDCALVYKDLSKKSVRKELNAYYEILMDFVPDSIGGRLPDDGLYSRSL